MTTSDPATKTRGTVVARAGAVSDSMSARVRRRLSRPGASVFAIVVALLWTLPTFGLLVSSFRPERAIKTTGWWTAFADPSFTLDNYHEVLFGTGSSSGQLASYFVNSVVVTVPSVVLTVGIAALVAYPLACMEFRGKNGIFIGIFALQIVPLQMALIPLLQMFTSDTGQALGMTGYPRVWLAHTAFGLPLAIFLLHNFMADLPRELLEAAQIDGAGPGRIFRSVVLPLVVPALASLTIFQFLWVWNDLLVSLVFVGGSPEYAPLTVRIAEMAGTRGNDWQLLTAGAFVSMAVPLLVFFTLQRYFVRGLLAGGLKG